MKKYIQKNKIFFIAACIFILRYLLLQVVSIYSHLIPLQREFLGPLRRANFDGAHYLIISKFNYGSFEQAFFPLFPLLIHIIRPFFLYRTTGAFIIVYLSLIATVILFLKLALLDMPKNKTLWALILFLLFPTSFFLGSIYTESLFLSLSLGAFYAMRKEKFFVAALLAGLASATRFVGVFICISLIIEMYLFYRRKHVLLFKQVITYVGYILLSISGIVGYMLYLWNRYKDPLLFIHVQASFGAHRTTGSIILLPQVLFRYIKIFISVSPFSQNFLIALLEFITFSLFLTVLAVNWKKIRLSYLIFSLCVILLPTLTGTLSSEPRYVLAAFPFFFILGGRSTTWLKIVLATTFGILLCILLAFFLQGYFIA